MKYILSTAAFMYNVYHFHDFEVAIEVPLRPSKIENYTHFIEKILLENGIPVKILT